MTAVNKVLIVGGGFSGIAAAIELRKQGIAVDLIERDPDWRPEGAGISLGAATLRALSRLGVYEAFQQQGFTSEDADLVTPAGHKIATLSVGPAVGSDIRGEGGILRPVLGKILADKVLASGAEVRLGISYQSMEQQGDSVAVQFSDGSSARYDLVIGAEGLHSQLRQHLFPQLPAPEYVGQGVWRAVFPRPETFQQTRLWLGDSVKVGLNPCSQERMYMFITEIRPNREHIDPSTWADAMAALLQQFPDPFLQALIPHLYADDAHIDYRPLFNLLVPMPWNVGRIVLIGDTVAATTPHLASGACIGIESGIVLAEELGQCNSLQQALDQFHQRRWERCRLVVENSARLAQIEINHGDKREHGQITVESFKALAQPI